MYQSLRSPAGQRRALQSMNPANLSFRSPNSDRLCTIHASRPRLRFFVAAGLGLAERRSTFSDRASFPLTLNGLDRLSREALCTSRLPDSLGLCSAEGLCLSRCRSSFFVLGRLKSLQGQSQRHVSKVWCWEACRHLIRMDSELMTCLEKTLSDVSESLEPDRHVIFLYTFGSRIPTRDTTYFRSVLA